MKDTPKEPEFLTYVRTMIFFELRLRSSDRNEWIFISVEEIEKRFYPYPKFDVSKELQLLMDFGGLERKTNQSKKGRTYYTYRILKPGPINLNYIEPRGKELDAVTTKMLSYLKLAGLPEGSPSTPYMDVFLETKDKFARLFFNVDDFSGRVHTPISNFHRPYRPNLTIDGEETTSFDVKTMQPLLLGKILKKEIGDNEYSRWINDGKDIYVIVQEKMELPTRDEAKKKFFKILFGWPNKKLARMFGDADWIDWINEYKSKFDYRNPRTEVKVHNNLSWMLQTTEVDIMYQAWSELVRRDIPFLSVHDEIIVKRSNSGEAEKILRDVLNKSFEYYSLNIDKGKSPDAYEEFM